MKNINIARSQNISTRRVKQLYSEYKKTGIMPVLKKPGKKTRIISEKYIKLIDEAYKEHKISPLALEKIIQRKHKIHIPHNTIYKHMLDKGQITENPKKKKQRKWVRYERTHSLSLVHTDWCEYNERQVIAFLDDASRKILSCMEFDNATTDNSIIALNKAIECTKNYGGLNKL